MSTGAPLRDSNHASHQDIATAHLTALISPSLLITGTTFVARELSATDNAGQKVFAAASVQGFEATGTVPSSVLPTRCDSLPPAKLRQLNDKENLLMGLQAQRFNILEVQYYSTLGLLLNVLCMIVGTQVVEHMRCREH